MAPIEPFGSADMRDISEALSQTKGELSTLNKRIEAWSTRNPGRPIPQQLVSSRARMMKAEKSLIRILDRHPKVVAAKNEPPIGKYRRREK